MSIRWLLLLLLLLQARRHRCLKLSALELHLPCHVSARPMGDYMCCKNQEYRWLEGCSGPCQPCQQALTTRSPARFHLNKPL